jgi:hypothetical protein
VYGEGVKLDEATPIAALLAAPQDYVGKTVRIDGVVTDVCRQNGCWVKIASPRGGSGVLVKVEDGVIVFPFDSLARRASVEGVFEAVARRPDPPQPQPLDEARTHPAEEGHAPHVCAALTRGDVHYRIRGLGAILY